MNSLAYYHIITQARKLHPVQNRLIIKLPEKLNIKPKEYNEIPITPELKNIQPYRPRIKGADKPKAQ